MFKQVYFCNNFTKCDFAESNKIILAQKWLNQNSKKNG